VLAVALPALLLVGPALATGHLKCEPDSTFAGRIVEVLLGNPTDLFMSGP
jgi:hypothetical protein